MITNKPNYNVCFSIEKLGHDIQPSTIPRANIIKHNIYYNEFYYILTLQGLVTLQSIQSSFLKTPTKPVNNEHCLHQSSSHKITHLKYTSYLNPYDSW